MTEEIKSELLECGQLRDDEIRMSLISILLQEYKTAYEPEKIIMMAENYFQYIKAGRLIIIE